MRHEKIILISIYVVLFLLWSVFIFQKYNYSVTGHFYYEPKETLTFNESYIHLIPTYSNGTAMRIKGNKLYIDVLKLQNLKINPEIKKEYNISKQPYFYSLFNNRSNAIIIGDSNSEGGGVAINETYPYFLSKEINANVINLGFHGLNTKLEIERFKLLGLKFKPKLVILQYCENDYQDTLKYFTFIKNGFNFLEKAGYNFSNQLNYAKMYTTLHMFYFDYVFMPHKEEMENKNIEEPCIELENLSEQYNFSVMLVIFGLRPFQRNFITNIATDFNWTTIDLDKELGWKWHPPYTISEENPHFSIDYNKKVAKLLSGKANTIIFPQ